MDIETEYEQSSGLRIPPHSGEAEQAVLGSLMLDEKAWEAVSERIIDNDFYQQNHRLIYRAIEQLVAEEQFVDLVTVAAKLDRKSTRLNSSHVRISYAVFCLKKKKN